MPFDVMRGFQVGQATGSGGEGLAAFVKTLNDRMELQAKSQATIGAQVGGEVAKAQIQRQAGQEFLHSMTGSGGVGGMEGGGVPPGTEASVQVGNTRVRMPLNRPFSQQEAGTLRQTPEIRHWVDRLKELVQETGYGEAAVGKVPEAVTGFPGVSAVAGALGQRNLIEKGQEIRQATNNLERIIPFTEGGKQLTETEKKAVTRVISNIAGRPDRLVLEDLERIASSFEYAEQLVRQGRGAEARMAILQAAGVAPDEAPAQEPANPFSVSAPSDDFEPIE